MNTLRTILDEFLGLFVDDISFALAIVFWIVVSALLLPLVVGPFWQGILLLAGLLLILAESTWRRARA